MITGPVGPQAKRTHWYSNGGATVITAAGHGIYHGDVSGSQDALRATFQGTNVVVIGKDLDELGKNFHETAQRLESEHLAREAAKWEPSAVPLEPDQTPADMPVVATPPPFVPDPIVSDPIAHEHQESDE